MQMYWIAPEQMPVWERPLLTTNESRRRFLYPGGALFFLKKKTSTSLIKLCVESLEIRYVFEAKFRAPNDMKKEKKVTPHAQPPQAVIWGFFFYLLVFGFSRCLSNRRAR